jgi:hypothetical protein
MSTGDESGTDFATMRGRNFPALRQFTVFLENRVGQLLDLVRRFETSRVHIVGFSISDSSECAFVRLILSHPDQGREILDRAGLAVVETDVVGVELPSGEQPLVKVCKALLQVEANLIQAYSLLAQPHGVPAVVIRVENIDTAIETLTEKGFTLLTEGDLQADD